MDQAHKLMHDISATEENTAKLENDVKKVINGLETIHNDLEISEKVNNSLKKLDSSLTTAKDLLTIVSIIPEIGSAASVLKTTITEFQVPVKVALKSSNAIEKVASPIRKTIEKIEPQVQKVDHALLEVMNTENQFADILGSATHCIDALPTSDIKTELTNNLNSASKTIDNPVLKFNKAQLTLLSGIEKAEDKCEEIKHWMSDLISLDNAINAVISQLKPLISALSAIKSAFKHVIRVPYGGYPKICHKWGVPYPCGWHTVYFSFSIQQILNGISGVLGPVMDLLNKAMNVVLKPLLKALNLNIQLPAIPGLDVLNKLKDNLEAYFNDVVNPLNGLLNELSVFNGFIKDVQAFINQIEKINNACQIKHK